MSAACSRVTVSFELYSETMHLSGHNMTARTAPAAAKNRQPISLRRRRFGVAAVVAPAIMFFSQCALADEGGVSFWVPGFFGSLAATPQQPGWSVTSILYNTNVSATGNAALAREITIGQFNPAVNTSVSASIRANVTLEMVAPTYVFATPFLGGQAAISVLGLVGVNDTH